MNAIAVERPAAGQARSLQKVESPDRDFASDLAASLHADRALERTVERPLPSAGEGGELVAEENAAIDTEAGAHEAALSAYSTAGTTPQADPPSAEGELVSAAKSPRPPASAQALAVAAGSGSPTSAAKSPQPPASAEALAVAAGSGSPEAEPRVTEAAADSGAVVEDFATTTREASTSGSPRSLEPVRDEGAPSVPMAPAAKGTAAKATAVEADLAPADDVLPSGADAPLEAEAPVETGVAKADALAHGDAGAGQPDDSGAGDDADTTAARADGEVAELEDVGEPDPRGPTDAPVGIPDQDAIPTVPVPRPGRAPAPRVVEAAAPQEIPIPRDAEDELPNGVRWSLLRQASGEESARVHLEHPSLGSLRLDFAFDEGALDVRVLAPSLLSAIRLADDEDRIRELLDEHGARLAQLRVSVDGEAQRPDSAPERARLPRLRRPGQLFETEA